MLIRSHAKSVFYHGREKKKNGGVWADQSLFWSPKPSSHILETSKTVPGPQQPFEIKMMMSRRKKRKNKSNRRGVARNSKAWCRE